MPSQLSAMFLQIKTKRFCANEIELSLRNRQSLAISRNKQRPLHISYPNENLQPYHHFKECHQIQKNANFRNSTSCRIFDEVKDVPESTLAAYHHHAKDCNRQK